MKKFSILAMLVVFIMSGCSKQVASDKTGSTVSTKEEETVEPAIKSYEDSYIKFDYDSNVLSLNSSETNEQFLSLSFIEPSNSYSDELASLIVSVVKTDESDLDLYNSMSDTYIWMQSEMYEGIVFKDSEIKKSSVETSKDLYSYYFNGLFCEYKLVSIDENYRIECFTAVKNICDQDVKEAIEYVKNQLAAK